MRALSYSDGVVTIRRLGPTDLERDLEAKDDEQIDWLWEPGQREHWEAMSLDEQRTHVLGILGNAYETFGEGPKWAFGVDTTHDEYVAYVDCDLANNHVPHGAANVSYSAHPRYRGRGYVSRAVRLVLLFLKENTDAQEAHINVDAENTASLRVAIAVGANVVGEWTNDQGRTMIRHLVPIR